MQVSAEIRWFWESVPPSAFETWFCNHGDSVCGAGGGAMRCDEYFRDSGQVELGLKRRGGKSGIEIKGLVAEKIGDLQIGEFIGPIELWSKWTSASLQLHPNETINVPKQRWLRKFDTFGHLPLEISLDEKEQPADRRPLPDRGCNVELTRIELPHGGIWWSFGFESFGPIETVGNSLQEVAVLVEKRNPPKFGNALRASYPVWLKQILMADLIGNQRETGGATLPETWDTALRKRFNASGEIRHPTEGNYMRRRVDLP